LKTLDRYVLRELIVPFLIGTVAVTLMWQANTLIYLQKTFNLESVPSTAIAQVLLFLTPQYLNETIPVGTALAVSLAVSRLARESELTAMRAAGCSLMRALMPVLVFGGLVAVGEFYLTEKLTPQAERKATDLERKLFFLGASPVFKSNVALELGDYAAFIGTVTRDQDNSMRLTDILLAEPAGVDEVRLVKASVGVYRDGDWVLQNAYLYDVKGDEVLAAKATGDQVIHQRIALQDFFAPPEASEQSLSELRQAIARGKAAGQPTQELEVEYQTRFSVPAACLVFALVAPVFALAFTRSGAFVGVLLSIVLVFAYYNVYVVCTDILARNPSFNPVVAAWLPNVLFGALGVWGLRRLE